jgi:hypothetical protein
MSPLKYIKIAIILSIAAAPAAAEEFSQAYSLGNGLRVNIFTPETILESMTERDAEGNLIFRPACGGSYIFIEDVSHPSIYNPGDGAFFSMDEEVVLGALGQVDVGGMYVELDIDVYLLPMPRLYTLRSTSVDRTIFLSPGTYMYSEEVTSFIVTHELGHCFQNYFMPQEDTEEWREYLTLRSIYGDPDYSENSIHCCRPKEIFAEDFRFLFGGEPSRYSGSIENPDLLLPSEVEGLEEFLVSLVPESGVPDADRLIASAVNYPNPFNPSTTISVQFAAPDPGRDVDVRIYAANGSIVRRLYSGKAPDRSRDITWDGRTDGGGQAASGVYFYRITSGPHYHSGKMLLLR